MLKITLAAAAITAIATFGVLPSADARSLSPRNNVTQSEGLVINVHRADRDRDYRRARPQQRRLHRGQVIRRLSWRGYYGFSRVRDRGSIYVVKAFSPRGHRVRLRVDAFSGEVINRRPIRRDRSFDRGWRTGGSWSFSW